MSDDDAPELQNVPEPGAHDADYGSVGRIGTVAQEFMAQIEEAYGANAEVGVVAMCADLRTVARSGDGDEFPITVLTWRSNEPRRWVQAGIFASVATRIRRVFG